MAKADPERRKRDPWYEEEPFQPHWPHGVQPMTIGATERLGFDKDGKIYWDGRMVSLARRLDLNWWQAAAAIIAALSTLALAVVAWLEYFKEL